MDNPNDKNMNVNTYKKQSQKYPSCGQIILSWASGRTTAQREPRRSETAHLLALVPEELSRVLDDLLVRELGVRLLLTQSQDLPQSHTVGPHVTGHGELPLREHTAKTMSIVFMWKL